MYISLTTSHNISTKELITIGVSAFFGKLERLKMQQIAFKISYYPIRTAKQKYCQTFKYCIKMKCLFGIINKCLFKDILNYLMQTKFFVIFLQTF